MTAICCADCGTLLESCCTAPADGVVDVCPACYESLDRERWAFEEWARRQGWRWTGEIPSAVETPVVCGVVELQAKMFMLDTAQNTLDQTINTL